ncbi:MAG: glucoamylase family protein [Elusimicrobiota bacterium]
MRKRILVYGLVLLMGIVSQGFAAKKTDLSSAELKYLQDLAKATYSCIKHYVDPKTGLPLDNTAPGLYYTSSTNIGLYCVSLIAAVEMGLETKAEALKRISKTLDSLDKIEKWNGMPINWIHVSTLQKEKNGFVSTVDLGNLYAGLMVTAQAFPELDERCDRIIKAADWTKLYNAKAKYLNIGYESVKGEYTPYHYVELGSEARTANFLSIVSSQLPLESWNVLSRGLEEKYGVNYLKPGWQGGLFTQFLPGIFIDEEGTLMGKSAANEAYAQMLHMKKIKYRVWGWSPSDSPGDGYRGINNIIDKIVTPHACVLAVQYFPKEVIKNLKELEKLGVRPLHLVGEEEYDFGFRDAMSMKSGWINKNYLVLDQAMLFLSLANFLDDKVINRYYQADPLVQRGLRLFPEYKNRKKGEIKYPVNLALELGLPQGSASTGARPEYPAKYAAQPIVLDGQLNEWKGVKPIVLDLNHFEFGNMISPLDLGATFYFLWDEQNLYFAAQILDESNVAKNEKPFIYKDDVIELFMTAKEQLTWGNPDDFQIGFGPSKKEGLRVYAWFQKGEPGSEQLRAKQKFTPEGYSIEAAISWNFLGIKPKKGLVLGISPAVHDVDTDGSLESKMNYYFKKDGDRIILGKVTLEK